MSSHTRIWDEHEADPPVDDLISETAREVPEQAGEEYQVRTGRPDLDGRATEADVVDQAHDAWVADEPGDDEPGSPR